MDFVNKIVGGGSKDEDNITGTKEQREEKPAGFMDKLNSVAGGGKEGEKNEDALDKGLSPSSQSPHQTILGLAT